MPKNLTPEGREAISRAGKARWAAMVASGKAAEHINKMTRARSGYRKSEKGAANGNGNGNGQSPRAAIADAFDEEHPTQWMKYADDGVDGSADAGRPLDDAIRHVQAAIKRGEVEVVAENAHVAFYRVARWRID
jgi:hypothetical protein